MTSRLKIVILTGSHLCNNPRAVKEADALSEAGFDVEVLGWIADRAHADEDRQILQTRHWRFTPCIDLLDRAPMARVAALGWRLERRLGFEMASRLRMFSAVQLGGWRRRILAEARERNADFYIAHSAMTLWVAAQLRREGRAVGADMEDWFSREQAAPYPSTIVAELEAEVLRDSMHASCTSHVMSEALAAAYGCRPPTVVYNAFPWADRDRLDGLFKDRKNRSAVSLHWYSQTLGPGRGLEELCAAMTSIKGDLEVHIRGTASDRMRGWLDSLIPSAWKARVHVHAPVSNAELLSRISEHDIGFAGETAVYGNHDLTVSNKLLQYLLAGLAVIASDTRGQREIAGQAAAAVSLYREGDAISLAEAINRLLAQPDRIAEGKVAALAAARDSLCWERVAPRLLESVRNALAPKGVAGA